MAEEELTTSSVASPTTADSHKRKLEDLELSEAPDQHANSEANLVPGSVDNAAQCEANGGAVESEPKRRRLESNGDTDGLVLEDGHQEEEKEDEMKGKESKHPEDDNGQSVGGQEPEKEQLETIREEPASDENENPEIGSTKELGPKNSEGKEPSEERPREGDIPVLAAEQHPGSDTQILSRKMEVPNDKVGVLIGKAGDTIRSLQDNSGARIQIVKDADADLQSATRPLELIGTLHNINKAEKLIEDVIAEADAGGSPSLVARGFSIVQATGGAEQLEIQVPSEKVGFIIGKGGDTIRNLQTRSGARIQLIQQNLSVGEQSMEKTVRVTGNKKQIETAIEMIKDVINQTTRPSPLSGGYNQQSFHPRGPVVPPWVPWRPPHAQFSGYDYPQRGPYPSQGSKYPPSSYGNYPPQHAPRSNFDPSWEQRPPASLHGPSPQGSYNYGWQQGPNQPPPYSQTPARPYVHGYNEVKYDQHVPQHFGQMGSLPTTHAQGGRHSGYGPDDQFKPPMYGMQPQVLHSQSYGQAKPNQPGEVPYRGLISSYGQNVAPQQSHPYASTGPMQQSYPPYGSAPSAGGYNHSPAPASTSQQPPMYGQAGIGPSGGYGSYPTAQPAYTEPPAANNAAYGYQVPADPPLGGAQGPTAAAYPAPAAVQSGYPQPGQIQPSYDQPGGYGNIPAQTGYGNISAQTGYGNSVSTQPVYPQYDTSQIYGSHV